MNIGSNILKETCNLSHYQYYKSNTVSKYLLGALNKIEESTHGISDVCQNKILKEKLDIMPAALSFVKCKIKTKYDETRITRN